MADRPLSVQYEPFNQATGATHVVAAGVLDMSVKILGVFLLSDGTVDVTFQDSVGVDLIGPLRVAVDTPVMLPVSSTDNPGWQRTPTGLGLNLVLGGAVQVTGVIVYQHVPAHAEVQ